jgi:hypothetical protein
MNLLVGGVPGGATRFRQARQPKQLYRIIAEKFGVTALCRPLFGIPCARNAHYVATLFEQQNRGNHDVGSAREPHARRMVARRAAIRAVSGMTARRPSSYLELAITSAPRRAGIPLAAL